MSTENGRKKGKKGERGRIGGKKEEGMEDP
jgi:hypothetical protein